MKVEFKPYEKFTHLIRKAPGKVFIQYKKANSGKENSVLLDFFIGAHASVLNIPLLTRDVARYKTYFSKLHLIHP
ncbi:hypothetical protein [Candidatus Tisiphia endosymbiont of Parasteatoda lunata]|uniref:hypothetical protein n=1 Tax=Candidatus Tisiphia endosymbiont of Parasteatoda lunata TaxID=3066275 RepID=UPI00313CEDD5